MKILLIFLTIAGLIGIIVTSLAFYKINNMWLFHIYTLLETSLLLFVFSYWQKKYVLRNRLRLIILVFALIWIGAKLYLESFSRLDSYTASLECVLLVGVSAYTLFNLNNENVNTLFRDQRFWVSSAVLFYFAGNAMTFSLGNIFNTWLIHSVLNIFANLLYTGGFIFQRRLNICGS